MVKDRGRSIKEPTDREFIKQRLKEIRDAKKSGNERKAQQLADELFLWLGWS